ncbi:MAG: lamin tail domain-containing protein [Bacteroidales bacterium]
MKKYFRTNGGIVCCILGLRLLVFTSSANAASESESGTNRIRINEIAVAGNTLWDGNDWIELYNESDKPVSLKGYTISVSDSGKKKKRGISSSSLDSLSVPARGFLVLCQQTHFEFNAGPSGQCIWLNDGKEIVDEVCYEIDLTDKTYGCRIDGMRNAGNGNGLVVFDQAESTIGSSNHIFTFIFTSDQHYGIDRDFRGKKNVDATIVNRAMVAQMNHLDRMVFPNQEGVQKGDPVQVNYLIQTGDITSRSEKPGIPLSAQMMKDFENDYLNGLTLSNVKNERIPVWIAPGNHDLSNAIGHARIPNDKRDKTAMVKIYNEMLQPAVPLTNDTYDPMRDRVNYMREIGGVQFAFVQMWPDRDNRVWIESKIDSLRPVFLFTHDQPDVEAKHLQDPAYKSGEPFAFETRFEYLVGEKADPGTDAKGSTATQQRELVDFLKRNRNIRAYFHGNENYNEFYTYEGPDKDIALPVFRVDSPMKGVFSEENEKLLSFQLVTFDRVRRKMTVREVFWNSTANADAPLTFGDSKTIDY